MSGPLQTKRGTTAANLIYTGPLGEVTTDLDVGSVRVHDGLIAGGVLQAPLNEKDEIEPKYIPPYEVVTPINLTPIDSATDEPLEPTLTASSFALSHGVHPGVLFQQAQWQIATDVAFNVLVHSAFNAATTYAVPNGLLSLNTTYYWRVRYQDSNSTWSQYSVPTTFVTLVYLPGEQIFTTSGTFVVPAGVTSVCAVCVGAGGTGGYGTTYPQAGGGGGGGANGWKNDIAVTPGQTITVTVPAPGGTATFGPYLSATGGSPGAPVGSGQGGVPIGADGGGNGGNGYVITSGGGGGGGAGGYLGNGGQGGGGLVGGAPQSGSGGGAGGSNGMEFQQGLPGGGVGLFGHGPDGVAVSASSYQWGGSGSASGGVTPYGGGAGGVPDGGPGGSITGAGLQTQVSAVRIIWGTGRSFPYNAL